MSQTTTQTQTPVLVKHFDPIGRRWIYNDDVAICVHGKHNTEQCHVCDKAAERMPK